MIRVKRETLFDRVKRALGSEPIATTLAIDGRVLKAAHHGLSADEVSRLTGFHPEPEDPKSTYTVEFYEEAK